MIHTEQYHCIGALEDIPVEEDKAKKQWMTGQLTGLLHIRCKPSGYSFGQ